MGLRYMFVYAYEPQTTGLLSHFYFVFLTQFYPAQTCLNETIFTVVLRNLKG